MGLWAVILILGAIAVVMWALNKYGGEFMDGQILRIINIVVIVAVVFWLLNLTGLLSLIDIPFPRVRG